MREIPLGARESSGMIGEQAVVVEDRVHSTTMRAIIVHHKRTSLTDIM
ncbi:MAG: hypothetical protein AAF945_11565 [Actinomycetota bacterium]